MWKAGVLKKFFCEPSVWMLTEMFPTTVGTKEEIEALLCRNRKDNFNLVLKYGH